MDNNEGNLHINETINNTIQNFTQDLIKTELQSEDLNRSNFSNTLIYGALMAVAFYFLYQYFGK